MRQIKSMFLIHFPSRDIALSFIHCNFSLVAAEEEFLEISTDLLCQLIASEYLRYGMSVPWLLLGEIFKCAAILFKPAARPRTVCGNSAG